MKRKLLWFIILSILLLSACTGRKDETEPEASIPALETIRPTEVGTEPADNERQAGEGIVIGEAPAAGGKDDLEPYVMASTPKENDQGNEDTTSSPSESDGDGFIGQAEETEPSTDAVSEDASLEESESYTESIQETTEAPAETEVSPVPESDEDGASNDTDIPLEFDMEGADTIWESGVEPVPDEAFDGIQSIYEAQIESQMADGEIQRAMEEYWRTH